MHLGDSSLSSILSAFAELLGQLLADFIQKVLIGYAEHAMALKKKPFVCNHCGNDEEFSWWRSNSLEDKAREADKDTCLL